MTKDRLWLFGAIAVMLVVLLGGYALGISPTITQAGLTNAQAATMESGNTASAANLTTLRTQFSQIGKQQTQLNKLRESVPEGAASAAFLNELVGLSGTYGVALKLVSVSDATLYSAPASTTTPSATTTPTPAPTASATTTTATPATPTTTTGGLVLIPVTISAVGPFDNVRDFLGAVQTGSRLYFAASVSETTDLTTNITTGTFTGDMFSLAGTSDPVKKPASTTTATATPTPTPTPTATLTPTPNPTKSTTTTSGSTKSGGTSNPPATTPPPAPTSTPSSAPPTDPDSTS